MNARTRTIITASVTMTSLALCGAFAMFSASCASDSSSNGGTPAKTGGTTGSGTGGTTGGGTGGTPAAGGGDTVTFSAGQASGPMTGYGWIAMGSADSASDPTCGGTAITFSAPCGTSTTWSSANPSALCLTGNIPIVAGGDYTSNWGLQIGVNASQTEGTPIAKTTYTSMALSFTGTPATGLRAEIHLAGDDPSITYCFDGIASGTAIPLSTFNKQCWAGAVAPAPFPADGASKIDKIGLQVSSSADAAIPVSNLCLTGATFK